MVPSAAKRQGAAQLDASPHWSKGLLYLTLVLTAVAPLAMYSGRIPGLGEFDYSIYYRLLFYNDVANASAMLATLLLALALRPLRSLIVQLADLISRHPAKTCILAFVALAAAARVVYQDFPLAMDEYAPLLQARIYAHGDIAITYPRELLDRMVVPEFQGKFILVNRETGQAASAYWPGLALLMTPFALFNGEWLLNPLLGAIGLWLIGDLARQAGGKNETRGWAMLAALACPQYTVNALSFYAMTGLLTLNLLYLWLLLRPGARNAVLAGIVGSIALVMHNPIPHVLFAAPVGIWLLTDRERRRRILPLAIGYLPLTLTLVFGWLLLTDSMGLRPAAQGASNLGTLHLWLHKLQETFVLPGIGLLTAHSYALWKTLIWTAPGLVLTACITRPIKSLQKILLAAMVLTFGFYFFISFDQGHGWGYRYIHSAWALVPIGLGLIAIRDEPSYRQFAAAVVLAGLLATPVFMWTTHRTISTSNALQLPAEGHGKSFVFIADRPGMYTADLVRNYPVDTGHIVRMQGASAQEDAKYIATIAPGAVLQVADERGSSWHLPPKN